MTRSVLALVAVLVAAAIPSSAAALNDAQDPVLASYIVVLKPDAARSDASARSARPLVAAVAQDLSRAHAGAVTSVYQYALKGFAARLTADQADALANDARVEYVEQDQVFHTLATQTPATWGLDRVDQRDLPLNNSYTYNQTGQGVHAYIIDTGIRATHQEFTGRIGNGFTAVNDGNGTNDCNGHGTHVAGTVGGTTYGVAKQVTLHAVRVLGCSGSGSNGGRHRRRRLGHAEPRLAGRREHEPRRRRLVGSGSGRRQLDQRRASATRSPRATATPTRATARRRASPRRSRSAPRPTPTPARRSPTSGPASTSSRRARASPRPGTPATARRTRSAERRWRLRTWPARWRSTSRRIRPRRRRRRRWR